MDTERPTHEQELMALFIGFSDNPLFPRQIPASGHGSDMGKRRQIALVAIAALIALTAVFFSNYLSEPHYQGKSLSDWVVTMRGGPDIVTAREVVHQIGPEHLPILLTWLRKDDCPTWTGRFHNFKPSLEQWLMERRIIKSRPISWYTDPKFSYRSLGLLAFEELGPDGSNAIPALIEMLGHREPKTGQPADDAGSAWLILPQMAPYSIGPLIQTLSNQDWQVRVLAAGALGEIGTNANAAIPVLQPWLRDPRLAIRMNASGALSKLGADPAGFLPVVIADLWPVDTGWLDVQVSILFENKSRAKTAVPVLLQILSNTPDTGSPRNNGIRGDVIAALQEIDPDAAARAGIKSPP
jgi:hypothetical protein